MATYAAQLFHHGLFKTLVFSGATSPTTADRFPGGEAAHYRQHAITLGVPDEAIIVEPRAANTGQNHADLRRERDRAQVWPGPPVRPLPLAAI